MSNNEFRLAISRPQGPGPFLFRYSRLYDIPVGVEGAKTVAEVDSERGRHGRFVLKAMRSKVDGQRQVAKWKHFRSHGVSVPDIVKAVVLEDGSHHLLSRDLSEGGRYQVLSTNNPELDTEKYKELIKQISPTTRKKLQKEVIAACEVASGLHTEDNPRALLYSFQPNAFMLAINPRNADDARVYVADFGVDITIQTRDDGSPRELLRHNLSMGADFYSWMTEEALELPTSHPLSTFLNPHFLAKRNDILLVKKKL